MRGTLRTHRLRSKGEFWNSFCVVTSFCINIPIWIWTALTTIKFIINNCTYLFPDKLALAMRAERPPAHDILTTEFTFSLTGLRQGIQGWNFGNRSESHRHDTPLEIWFLPHNFLIPRRKTVVYFFVERDPIPLQITHFLYVGFSFRSFTTPDDTYSVRYR